VEAGLPPASDRMMTTCFLAAVFHGIVILGVTFSSANRDAAGPDGPALEVVLVNEQAPRAAANPHARYVAQRSQAGGGNTRDGRTQIPRSSAAPVDQMGMPDGAGMAAQQADGDSGDPALLATSAPSVKILYFAPPLAAEVASKMPELLENRPDFGMTPSDEAIDLRLRGEAKNQLWVAADTRESDVAVYLDGWRRKIERVGTMNFPDVARRRKMSGTPVIEVTIGADGKLLQTVIRRSSGHAEIDEAAIRILKLAAPYDPFPAAMGTTHDQIRIAYEWQFLGGESQGTNVSYAAPNAAGTGP
jgi:protein TonB